MHLLKEHKKHLNVIMILKCDTLHVEKENVDEKEAERADMTLPARDDATLHHAIHLHLEVDESIIDAAASLHDVVDFIVQEDRSNAINIDGNSPGSNPVFVLRDDLASATDKCLIGSNLLLLDNDLAAIQNANILLVEFINDSIDTIGVANQVSDKALDTLLGRKLNATLQVASDVGVAVSVRSFVAIDDASSNPLSAALILIVLLFSGLNHVFFVLFHFCTFLGSYSCYITYNVTMSKINSNAKLFLLRKSKIKIKKSIRGEFKLYLVEGVLK